MIIYCIRTPAYRLSQLGISIVGCKHFLPQTHESSSTVCQCAVKQNQPVDQYIVGRVNSTLYNLNNRTELWATQSTSIRVHISLEWLLSVACIIGLLMLRVDYCQLNV